MIRCRLFKSLWFSDRSIYLQCNIDLPVVPQPGALIYVGGPSTSDYDENVVSDTEGSVFLRANEPRIYAWVEPVICHRSEDSDEGPSSPEQWLKHFETYGWRECLEPKPWSVRFEGTLQAPVCAT